MFLEATTLPLSPTTIVVTIIGGPLIAALLTVFLTIWKDRNANKREDLAIIRADKAATKVEEVAEKAAEAAELVAKVAQTAKVAAEEVKSVRNDLRESDVSTSTHLTRIEVQGEKIHTLVNDKMSEALKQNFLNAEINVDLAVLLLATDPGSDKYKALVTAAATKLAVARAEKSSAPPAESTRKEVEVVLEGVKAGLLDQRP